MKSREEELDALGLSMLRSKEYWQKIREEFRPEQLTSWEDQKDLGIAFFEMEMFSAAVEYFESSSKNNQDTIPLLWEAYLKNGEPMKVVLHSEEVFIGFSKLKNEEVKKALLYLRGRAWEQLGKKEKAIPWYQEVFQMDSSYRDVKERLQ